MPKISLKAYLNKLDDLLKNAHYDETIHHSRHIVKHFPKNVAAFRRLGKAYQSTNRLQEVGQVYRRILSVYPDDVESHVVLSHVAHSAKRGDEAIWHLERALEQDQNNAELLKQLRSLYSQYRGVTNPRFALTARAVAEQQVKAGLHQRAVDTLQDAIDRTPARIDLKLLMAHVLWDMGLKVEAAEQAIDVLKVLPDCLSANRILTQLWLTEQRPSDAQRYLARIEAVDPYLAFQIAQGSPPAENLIQLEELDYQREAQREISTRSPDWLSSLGDTVDDNNWTDSLIDDDEDSMVLEAQQPSLEPMESDEDSMFIETSAGDEAHLAALNAARQAAQENDTATDDLSDLFGDTFGDTFDEADEDAEDLDLADLFGGEGESSGGTGLTGLLGTLEGSEPTVDVEEDDPPTQPKRSKAPTRDSGLTGLLSMLGGGEQDEEIDAEAEEDPLEWMKDSGLHDAVTKATAPLEASDVDSLFEEMAARLNAENAAKEADQDEEQAEMEAPSPSQAAPVDADDPLAWLKSSGIEISDEEEPADLFADAFDDEEMDAQLAKADVDDPLAWLKSSGIEIEEDSQSIDLFGGDFDDDDVKGAEVGDDPMAWLKSSGLMDDDAQADDAPAEDMDWMQDAGEPARPQSSAKPETLTGTDADDEIDLYDESLDDDDVLADMLFMEDLAFSDEDDFTGGIGLDSVSDSSGDSSSDSSGDSSSEEPEDDAFSPPENIDFAEDAQAEAGAYDTGVLSEEWSPETVSAVEADELSDELDDQDAESMADQKDDNLPDWLNASGDDEDNESIEWLDIEGTFETPEEEEDDALDWMTEPQATAADDDDDEQVDAFDLFGDMEDDEVDNAVDEDGEVLPGWTTAAEAGAGVEESGLFDDLDLSGDEDDAAAEATPNWLSDIGEENSMDNLFGDDSDDVEESGGVPDWLSDIGGDELADELADEDFEDEEEELEAAEMPSWLAQAAPIQEEDDEEAGEDELAFLFEADASDNIGSEDDDASDADFLFGDSDEDEDELEPAGTPNWLSGIGGDEEASDEAFTLDEEEESEDELAFLFQTDTLTSDTDDDAFGDDEDALEPAETPDWLSAISGDEDSEDTGEFAFEDEDEEAEDELGFLFQNENTSPDLGTFGDDEDEDALEPAETPDWLSAISHEEDTEDEEFAFEAETGEAEEEAPDWLSGIAGAELEAEDEEEFDLQFIEGDEEEDTLIGESPMMGAGVGDAVGFDDEELDFDELEITSDEDEDYEDEELEAADVPDWLSGALVDDDEDYDEDEAFAEEEDDQPDWLKAAGIGAAGAAASALDDEDEEFEEADDVPDWLAAVGEDEAEDALSDEYAPSDEYDFDEEAEEADVNYISADETPGWLASAESPGTAAADDFVDDDQPDWLSALSQDAADEDYEEDEEEIAAGDIPDWLSAAEPDDYAEEDEEDDRIALFDSIEEDADLIDYDETEGEEIEPTPASNAPDWLNAMVPGLDVDYEAQEEDEPLESQFLEDQALSAEYDWLTEIVDEELRPPSSLPPAPAPSAAPATGERSRFSFSKRPSWLPKLSKRPAWMTRKLGNNSPSSGGAPNGGAPNGGAPNGEEKLSDDELPPWLQFDDDET